jgi:arylformamidase
MKKLTLACSLALVSISCGSQNEDAVVSEKDRQADEAQLAVTGSSGAGLTVSTCRAIVSSPELCSSTVSWVNAPAGSCVFIKGTGQLFACGGASGSAEAPWLRTATPGSVVFVLADSRNPGIVYREAHAPTSELTVSTCRANVNSPELCTSTVSWAKAPTDSCVFIKGTGQLFACGGASGSAEAPWLQTATPGSVVFMLADRRNPAAVYREAQAPEKSTDVAYRSDVDQRFIHQVSLDVHYGEAGKAKPVFMFIHGGGWISGDKAEVVDPKVSQVGSFAQANGYILVAANYRLVEVNASQQGLPVFTYKDQASDVAHAVAWVKKNISKHGGNPDKIVLVGHSAGAHLVPLAILDSRYLAEVGYSSTAVSRAILLDVHAYDIPYAISLMTNNRSFSSQIPSLMRMFGQTATQQLEGSPSNFIAKGKTMPSFLVISAGILDGVVHDITKLTSEAFAKKLNLAGIKASHSYFQNESHSSLVSDLNIAGDKAAASVKAFLSDFR